VLENNPDWPTNEGHYISAADRKPSNGFKGIRVQVEIKRKKEKDSALGEMIGPQIIQCPRLAAEYKHYEREKNALLERKRQLTASGPAATKSEPVTDAQLDDYIAPVRDVLMGRDEVLARRILKPFVDHVSVRKGSKAGTLYYTFYTFPLDIFFVPELSYGRTHALEGFRVRVKGT